MSASELIDALNPVNCTGLMRIKRAYKMWRNLKELGESSVEEGNRSDEDMEVDSDPEGDVPLASLQTTWRPATQAAKLREYEQPIGLNHNSQTLFLFFCFVLFLLQFLCYCCRLNKFVCMSKDHTHSKGYQILLDFFWIDDLLYSTILRSLEQTHCACMWFYISD